VSNPTFSNISAISWRQVLVVEEAGVPGENHRTWASNWSTLSLAVASPLHLFSTKSYTIAFDLLLLWMLLPSNFKDENIFYLFDWRIIQI
jgi:hypothetical protein